MHSARKLQITTGLSKTNFICTLQLTLIMKGSFMKTSSLQLVGTCLVGEVENTLYLDIFHPEALNLNSKIQ